MSLTAIQKAHHTIDALKARLKPLADEMNAILDGAKDRELTDAEESRFNALDNAAERLNARIEEASIPLKASRVTTSGQPGNPTPETNRMFHNHHADTNYYCKLHGLESSSLDDGGFKSLGEFLSVLGSGRYDPRIQAMQVAASGSLLGSGGAMVPERFLAEQLAPPGEDELILPKARTYSMEEGTLNISGFDAQSEAGGTLYGGFSAQWVQEGGTFTEATPVTRRITLTRKKLGLFTMASSELVSDSQYEQQLVPALQHAISDFRDAAFFTGDGLGKPKGILTDPAIVTVSKETNQPADTILTVNLDNMYARLHPAHVRRAAWYANPTCVPQLFGLVRTVGVAGQSVPVLNESNGQFSMYGLPLYLTSKLPLVGDAGDIILADVSQYAVGMGRGIAIARSDEFKFQTDQICWRAVWRGDGQGTWSQAFQPRNSAPTQSWCVKLQAR